MQERTAPRARHLAAALGLIALPLAVASLPATAGASPLFELVGASHGTGGLNPRAAGASAASTYFNPGLLPHAPQTFELGMFFLADQISVQLDARDGAMCDASSCDVPEVFGTGPESFRHADGRPIASPGLPTDWLEDGIDGEFEPRPRQSDGSGQNARAYQVLGLINPIFADRVVLGLYAMIPLSEFTGARAFYNDEREQFFSNSLHPELYSDRLNATSLAFGAGGKITDQVSAGVSFTLNLRNRAAAPVYISNLSDLNTVLLDSDIGVEASVSPHAGVVYDPMPALRLGATVHTEQALEIETGFDYVIATGVEQGTTVSFTHAYMPLTLGLAAHYALTERIGVAATTTFARWSQYEDRHSERPHPDYAWRDTVSGSAGARYYAGPVEGFVDVTFQPSPVPAQTGRSNYVDNDRLGGAAGGQVEFSLWGGLFRAGLQLQAHRLLHQHVTKFMPPSNEYPQLVRDEVPDDAVDGVLGDPIPGRDGLQTNNPGFPGFGSEGWVLGGAINLAILY